jgi:hypothetical protein
VNLNVTNGDTTVELLAQLGLPSLPWRDALHEGPVLPFRSDLRAEFLGAPPDEFELRDQELELHDGSFRLWFEADLYDQLQLVEILARLRARKKKVRKVWLHQIGEHVGIPHFGGLGQLTPEQLGATPEVRLSKAALELGARAYEALTAPDPSGLLAVESSDELRFLREAFVRLAQEYPWRRDGLSLTERRLLAGAPGTRLELFQRAASKEARPFLGDTFAFAALDRLAPLLRTEGDMLHLSETGERVLAGEAVHVPERWVGGVRITPAVPWRWDDGTETLVYAPVRA